MTLSKFFIASVGVDSQNLTVHVESDKQQLSHPRVSPNGRELLFTRHRKVEDGVNYAGTEIVRRPIGGPIRSLIIPAKGDDWNTNATWLPDGKGFAWLHMKNELPLPQIFIALDGAAQPMHVPTPHFWPVSDPHIISEAMTCVLVGGVNRICAGGYLGKNLAPVTDAMASRSLIERLFGTVYRGDFDPKLSPDGRQIAFMRWRSAADKTDLWTYVYSNVTRRETCLSKSKGDINPDWSSDGTRLVFSRIGNIGDNGLWTMKPDGSDRQPLYLSKTHVFNQPQFVPGSSDKRVIFQARRMQLK